MEILYNDYQSGFTGIIQSDIETFLGRSLTTEEASLFDFLLSKFEIYLCEKTKRQFKVLTSPDSYYEIYPVEEKHFFYNYPVSEIEKIEFDGEVVYQLGNTDNVLDYGIHFVYDENLIKFSNFAGYPVKRIKVNYRIAKFWSEDVKLAIVEEIAKYITGMDFAGRDVKSLSMAGLNVSFGDRGLLEKLIKIYRKVNI